MSTSNAPQSDGYEPSAGAGARVDVACADVGLLRSVAGGDSEAFAEFYDRHAAAALTLAFRIIRDRCMAEDICQEAFMAAWRCAPGYRPGRGTPRTWLLGIVRNRAIDAWRRRAVHARWLEGREWPLDDEPATEDTQAQAIRNVQAQAIRTTLGTLPDEQRETIVLAYYAGLSHTEIAGMLGEPLGTVKGRIRLGFEKLHHHANAFSEYPPQLS